MASHPGQAVDPVRLSREPDPGSAVVGILKLK